MENVSLSSPQQGADLATSPTQPHWLPPIQDFQSTFSRTLDQAPDTDVPQGLLFLATLTSQTSPQRGKIGNMLFLDWKQGHSKTSGGGSGTTWEVLPAEWCDTDSTNLSDPWWIFVAGPKFGFNLLVSQRA